MVYPKSQENLFPVSLMPMIHILVGVVVFCLLTDVEEQEPEVVGPALPTDEELDKILSSIESVYNLLLIY